MNDDILGTRRARVRRVGNISVKYAQIEWPALVDVSEERMGWMMIYQGRGRQELDGWCGDLCLPGLVSAYPTPFHHHPSSLFPSQTILINPLFNPCICISGSFSPPVRLPRKLRPVLVLCPHHLGFAGESFSTLLS